MLLWEPAVMFPVMVDLLASEVPEASESALKRSLHQTVRLLWHRARASGRTGWIPTTLSPAQDHGFPQDPGLLVLQSERVWAGAAIRPLAPWCLRYLRRPLRVAELVRRMVLPESIASYRLSAQHRLPVRKR